MSYSTETLRFAARIPPDEPGLVNRVSPDDAGWSDLGIEVRRFPTGHAWEHDTGECEAALVLLGGIGSVRTSRGDHRDIGRRPNVFAGMPWAVYLPRRTRFTVSATTDLEVALAWAPTDRDSPIQLVTPRDVAVEIRGGGSNTRQINGILPSGFDCHRLVCVEVYTPSGNWSSYPPHKHDSHRTDDGGLVEADLEEVYLYKMARPGGHALQRIYSPEHSLDATVTAHDGDVVIVPYGYHPVSAAFGYDCYYLNFLAGSAQSLACTDDPAHAWVKDTWTAPDPRVPLVTHDMDA